MVDHHAVRIKSRGLHQTLIVRILLLHVVLRNFEAVVYAYLCLVNWERLPSIFLLVLSLVVQDPVVAVGLYPCAHFVHQGCVVVVLGSVPGTALETVPQLGAVNAICIHSSDIHLHCALKLGELVLVLNNGIGNKSLRSHIYLSVYQGGADAALSLVHLVAHVNHLALVDGSSIL